jgi:hypothetical protein
MLEYLPDGVYIDGWTLKSHPVYGSGTGYVRNTYRSSDMTPAEVVSEALFRRLEHRFPMLST